MTPIFTSRSEHSERALLGRPSFLSRLGFLGCPLSIRFLGRGFFRFFFLCRLGRFVELHRADEQAGKEPATQKRVAEKFPSLRPAGSAAGQSSPPAKKALCVFRVAKRIEEPGCGVCDQIKKNRPQNTSSKQCG